MTTNQAFERHMLDVDGALVVDPDPPEPDALVVATVIAVALGLLIRFWREVGVL